MVFKIDLVAAEVALNPPLAASGVVVRGDIFCLDLGLGCVMKAVEVVEREVGLTVVLVAGKSVGGAREICVFPAGGWLG